MVTFTVNGKQIQCEPKEGGQRLLEFLREDMKLTGTKCGCDEKACGACTVLVDGEAKRSCTLQVSQMEGKQVITVEGLADGDKLDPVQEAFMEYNAVQCGFCTPGLLMATHGLLKKNPDPTEEEIVKALRINLCRCGTYPRVIQAVKKAAAVLRGENPEPYEPLDLSENGSFIGKSMPRKDLPDKLTGKTKFFGDYYFDNMLYGKAVYPPYPHAEILSIDTSEAYKVPGVELVLTAKDVPGSNRFGVLCKDQQVFCEKRVKYIGDTVAVVFADSPESAEKGAAAVKVEYQELPGVFSIEEALRPDAPVIPDADTQPSPMAYVAAEKGNICKEAYLHRGNVEQAFAECDVVLERTFHTKAEEHAWIEVDGAIACYDENHTLCVYAPNQSPFADRDQLAEILGLPKEEVRILHMPAGGAFGGKTELTVHAPVAIATMKTGRPARMVLSRKDSLRTHPKRHPYDMTYKVGANKDGKILAMKANLISDSGAYASWTPRVLEQGMSYSTGPYYIPNLDLEMKGIYTNNMVKGAMRGFGAIQSHFGSECMIDIVADELGIDPIEIREINGLERGLPMTTGQILTDNIGIDYKNTLKDAKRIIHTKLQPMMEREREKGNIVGIGVASGWRSVAGGLGPDENAGAIFELMPDGRISYRIACTEMGQGTHTSLAQIASEVTGIDWQDYDIIAGDTKNVPFGGGVMASRGLFLWGHPTIEAGKKFKKALLEKAGEVLHLAPETLTIEKSIVKDRKTGKEYLSLKELVKKTGNIRTEVDFYLPKTCPVLPNANEDGKIDPKEYRPHHTVAYNTTVAVVRIEPVKGNVELLYMGAISDGGQIINPDSACVQIEGALIMGTAYGMTNDFKIEKGFNVADTISKTKIPRIDALPKEMEVIFSKAEDPTGPFGSKGVAEIGILTPAPAICNAIYDAVGVRILELPVSIHTAEIKEAAQKILEQSEEMDA